MHPNDCDYNSKDDDGDDDDNGGSSGDDGGSNDDSNKANTVTISITLLLFIKVIHRIKMISPSMFK